MREHSEIGVILFYQNSITFSIIFLLLVSHLLVHYKMPEKMLLYLLTSRGKCDILIP